MMYVLEGYCLLYTTYSLTHYAKDILYIYSHIHYAKDTLYSTYIHIYIMPRTLPTLHIFTCTLCRGYCLLYTTYTPTHYAKDTYSLLYIHSHTHMHTHTYIIQRYSLQYIASHIHFTKDTTYTTYINPHTHIHTHAHTHIIPRILPTMYTHIHTYIMGRTLPTINHIHSHMYYTKYTS